MSQNSQNPEAEEEAKSMLVPKLRFPEFREAVGWGERPLSEFMSESRLAGSKGNVAKKITVKLWGNGVFEKNDTIQGSINTQYFRRNAGQFIYSKLDFLNQAFGIIPPSLDGFESTVDLPCFDFADGLIAAFLLEYVKRRDFYEKLGETADGSRKARRIHAETFLSFPIALPSPTEQQKIAECLSSVDELIAAQARKVDALKTHKKGLMQQLFPREGETQPRIRFPEFQKAGEWVDAPMGRLLMSSPDYGVNAAAVPFSDQLPKYLRITDISADGRYLPEKQVSVNLETIDRYYLDEGDIVLARTGASVGKSYQYRKEDGRLVFAGFLIRVKPHPKKLVSSYLANFFATGQFWKWVAVNSARSGQPGINSTEYSSLIIPLPPTRHEQQRIATCLSSLDALITAETQKLEDFYMHKKGLIQQLFPSLDEVKL
jgi:type I restriction enzyme, S subunit